MVIKGGSAKDRPQKEKYKPGRSGDLVVPENPEILRWIPGSKIRPLISKTETIAKVPFFAGFSLSEIPAFEPYFLEYRFRRKELLFLENEQASRLYVIKSGYVRLLKTAASAREMVIDIVAPGQICGCHMLFVDTYKDSAKAMEPTVTYGLSRENYDRLISRRPEIARGVINYLGSRLMNAHDIIISLVSSKVETRIAAVLVRLCESYGIQTSEGILIDVRLTRQDIADLVGSTVETTIRAISKLQKQGILTTVAGRILVRDYKAFLEMIPISNDIMGGG